MADTASLAKSMTQLAYLMHTEGDIAAEAAQRPCPGMTPDRKLREAHLRRAIADLGYRNEGADGRRIALDAETWIRDDDETWPFSFRRTCEALGVDPSYLRREIAAFMDRLPQTSRVKFKRTLG